MKAAAFASPGDLADYEPKDPAVSVALIDSSPTESFLGVEFDSEGRLFAGGREAVFAYDPDGTGGFLPRVELFRFPADSWVYDIAVRGDDLYVQTVTTLFVLPGARLKRAGITARPLLWGIPAGSAGGATYSVHQGLHGLAWGPDGDLRISFGDCVWDGPALPLARRIGHCFAYTADGGKLPLNGSGGVLRLRPDGTAPQLVAGGLRNPCGLVYDNVWNLFTHDNDHESLPLEFVPGRLLHVTDGADFAWPRGWTPAKSPDRQDLLDTLVDDLGRTIPVGQGYYDEPLLHNACGGMLLLARWGQSTLSAFAMQPAGASFRAREQVLLQGRNFMRPVGVAVAPDGRIVVATCGMRGNETSPVYPSDLLILSAAAKGPLLDRAVSLVDADFDQLAALLAGDSWQLRQGAHQEILRRGEQATARAAVLLAKQSESASPDPQLLGHLVHLVAASSEPSWPRIEPLVTHADANVRLQAVRAMAGGAGRGVSEAVFVAALGDPSPPVQLAAVEALFGFEGVPSQVVTGPARSTDRFLRQAASRLLADRLPADGLAALFDADDDAIRLAAILAAGRRVATPPAGFVPPPDVLRGGVLGPLIHHEGQIVDLRTVDRIGFFTMPAYWELIRDTRATEFDLLVRGLADANEAVSRQAAYFLSLIDDPRSAPAATAVLAEAAAARRAPVAGATRKEPPDPALAARLAAGAAGEAGDPQALLAHDWSGVATEGDPANGRRLFQAIGCSKCHSASLDVAVAGGPSLAGIGRRYAAEYIVESVLMPSKQIAEPYRGTTIVTDTGQVVSGLVVEENETVVELLLADATRRMIPKQTIDERATSAVSPMPQGLVQTAAELRDILAYLLGPEVN